MKQNAMSDLYQIIFIDQNGSFQDTAYLEHIVFSIAAKMMLSKNESLDDSTREDCMSYCFDEVVQAMTKSVGRISPSEIYPYCIRVISNSINHFQRQFYAKRKEAADDASNRVVTVSLDSTFDSEDSKQNTLASQLADTRTTELDTMTRELFNDIRRTCHDPRAMDWFILNVLMGLSNVEIGQMEHVSSSYVGRKIKEFIREAAIDYGEPLKDCLAQYQGGRYYEI